MLTPLPSPADTPATALVARYGTDQHRLLGAVAATPRPHDTLDACFDLLAHAEGLNPVALTDDRAALHAALQPRLGRRAACERLLGEAARPDRFIYGSFARHALPDVLPGVTGEVHHLAPAPGLTEAFSYVLTGGALTDSQLRATDLQLVRERLTPELS